MKGIYKITQKSTRLVYIGQSINIDNRWNQHANTIDSLSFHEAYRKDPADFIFEILVQNDNFTKEDLDRLEKQYINDYRSNDVKYGFNGTAGNGKLQKQSNSKRMLTVKNAIIREIFRKWVENKLYNINVLIIGVFKTLPEYLILKNCKVTILTDDFDYTCEEAKIIRVDGGDELMSKVKEIKKGEYDLIIANPPYNIGNKIIASFVDKAKESIVLAPVSCYKSNNVYKHIVELQLVDPKAFEDATITSNLNIAKLIDREIDQDWPDIEMLTYNNVYINYYKKNKSITHYSISTTSLGGNPFYDITVNESIPENRSFAITTRSVQNGVHKIDNEKTRSFDVRWNLDQNIRYADIEKKTYESRGITRPIVTFSLIYFNTAAEVKNLSCFWYRNPLMNDLLQGLNKVSGSPVDAIPHIDWSKDRDYEHCTLDDIMNWLDEDNR